MNPCTLNFNIHSLVKIQALDITDEVRAVLLDHFGPFAVGPFGKDEKTDIVISALKRERTVLPPLCPDALYPFQLKVLENEPVITLARSGKIDVQLSLTDPIRLYGPRTPHGAGRLLRCLFLCVQIALHRKKALLIKASAVSQEGKTLIFTGTKGTGKTTLLLDLLWQKWDFLSDDLLILHQNLAYRFRPFISLSEHHLKNNHRLFSGNPLSPKIKKGFWLMKKIGNFLESRYPPHHIPTRIRKLYRPHHRMNPADLFPQCKILASARPTHWITLTNGTEFQLIKSDRDRMAKDILAIHNLEFDDFTKIRQRLDLAELEPLIGLESLVRDNLGADQAFYRLTLPPSTDSTFPAALEKIVFP